MFLSAWPVLTLTLTLTLASSNPNFYPNPNPNPNLRESFLVNLSGILVGHHDQTQGGGHLLGLELGLGLGLWLGLGLEWRSPLHRRSDVRCSVYQTSKG